MPNPSVPELSWGPDMGPLSLVVGVVAGSDATLSPKSEARVRKLLRKLHRQYKATIIQVEALGQTSAETAVLKLAGEAGLSIDQAGAPPPGADDKEKLRWARHCQILLVLSAGMLKDLPELGRKVIAVRLAGIPPAADASVSPLEPYESGPVLELTTAERPGEGIREGAMRLVTWREYRELDLHDPGFLPAEPRSWSWNPLRFFGRLWTAFGVGFQWLLFWQYRNFREFSSSLMYLDEFNRDACKDHPKLSSQWQAQKTTPIPTRDQWTGPEAASAKVGIPTPGQLPDDLFTSRRRVLLKHLELFQVADHLGLKYQAPANRLGQLLIVLGALAALAKTLSLQFQDHQAFKVAFPVLFGLILLTWAVAWWSSFRRKGLDYRTLAEGLRVQFFWRLAEIREGVAEHYPRILRKRLGWIRISLRHPTLSMAGPTLTAASPGDKGLAPACLTLIEWFWILGQKLYFQDKVARFGQQVSTWKFWRLFFLGVGSLWLGIRHLGLVLGLFLSEAWGKYWNERFEHGPIASLPPWLDSAVGYGFFIVGGAVYAYIHWFALPIHLERYRRMSEIFDQAYRYFSDPSWSGRTGAAAADQNLFLDLGVEALAENAVWLREQHEHDDEGPHI